MVSSKLDHQIAIELANVRQNPSHMFDPKNRQALYTLFEIETNPTGKRAFGWLAIKTARFVLPIFEQIFPDTFFQQLSPEELSYVGYLKPHNLLLKAEEILTGQTSVEVGKKLVSDAHTLDWRYGKPAVPNGAEIAAIAARRALSEVCGYLPFQNLDKYNKIDLDGIGFVKPTHNSDNITLSGKLAELFKLTNIKLPFPRWKNGLEWDDKELAITAGDTAASAVIAHSCGEDYSNPFKPVCNSSKCLEFWQWWLTEAIPQAWESTQQTAE